MRDDAAKPLLLPADVAFTCQSCGACCRSDWLIGVDGASHARLRGVDWGRHDPALAAGEKFTPLPFPLPGGETCTFARKPDGACVFLTEDARCAIHNHLGYGAKPQVCREFPYHFVRTPDGIAVGLSFACTAVRGHHGRALGEQRAEILDVLAGSSRVHTLPDPIVLFSGLDIGWPEYRLIETALLATLRHPGAPLPRALIAGNVLINLCASLAQIEARARARREPPKETLAGGLAQLERDGYRSLLALAETIGYPRRAALGHLAPLYTWLQFSRRKMSRLGLVAALYANYIRFRRGRGRVPDLVTDGDPLDLAAVQAVRFDAGAPGVDGFLREYWTHVVFRKTLTPMHGVFRGYQTLLALYGLMKWAAKARAFRDGRPATGLDDVKDAVRLVEQRFVLHARFSGLFALSPILTVMADRIYVQPTFVARVVLEPE